MATSRNAFFINAAAGLSLLMLAGSSAAEPTTLTFDIGEHDETIVSPGGEMHGPFDWLESGFRIAGFWAIDVGTPGGQFQQGHTHLGTNYNGGATGVAHWNHAWTNDLQGLYITAEDGSAFDVISIGYRLAARDSSEPGEVRLPWSWGVDDPQMLIAVDWDPSQADYESVWSAIAIDDFGESPKPWINEPIEGFENVTGLYVSTTAARVLFDNIVIEKRGSISTPEPAAGLLTSGALLVLGVLRRSRLRRVEHAGGSLGSTVS